MSLKESVGTDSNGPLPPGCERVRCVCGADDYRIAIEKTPSGRLVRCNVCGTHYSSPRFLRQMIRDKAGGERFAEVDDDKVKEPDRWDRTFGLRLRLLNKHAPKKGKLLDVGCYAGFFLKIARDDGWEAVGIEPTIGGARFAIETLGLDVRITTLEEAQCESEGYDALALLEVIEHVPDPNAVLREANRVVKPGGLILVETPTIDNWAVRLLRGKWRHFIDGHFWFFSEKTLAALLEKHGFDVVEAVRMGRYTSIRHIAGVLRQHFRPLSRILDIVLVRLLRLGGVTVYLDLRDNVLVVARKKD